MSWIPWLKEAGFTDQVAKQLSEKLEANDLQIDLLDSIKQQHLEKMELSLGQQLRFMAQVHQGARDGLKSNLRNGKEFFEKKQNFNRGGAREVHPERKALFDFAKQLLHKM